MLTTISTKIAERVTKGATAIKYDRDVYIYGIEIILSTIGGVLSIFVLSMLMSEVELGVVFLIIFCSLRIVSGGYHAKTYTACFIISNLCFLTTIVVHKILENRITIYGWSIWFFLMLKYISRMKQQYHTNHQISSKKKEVCKKYFKVVVFTVCIIGLVLLILEQYRLFEMETVTMTMVAVLNLQINKNEKEQNICRS